MTPVGILGGTFDPVHLGHLRCALELRQDLDLAAVHLIPCAVSPHKPAPVATDDQRLAFLRQAVAGTPELVVDDREISRGGVSYTVDTLASLRDDLGGQPLALIIGMDALNGFHQWHRWQRILELTHIIVARRPGFPEPTSGSVSTMLAERGADGPSVLRAGAGRILVRNVTQMDISASRIRDLVARDLSIRFLVPERVETAIRECGCYRPHPEPAVRGAGVPGS